MKNWHKLLITCLGLVVMLSLIIVIVICAERDSSSIKGEITIKYLDGSIETRKYVYMHEYSDETFIEIKFENDPNSYYFSKNNVEIKEYD